jgi:hypothetical protein
LCGDSTYEVNEDALITSALESSAGCAVCSTNFYPVLTEKNGVLYRTCTLNEPLIGDLCDWSHVKKYDPDLINLESSYALSDA